MTLFNARRLRDYPRLMLLTTWVILAINLIFHRGWQGGLGQIIGHDFLVFYSVGEIYRVDPGKIYDFEAQSQAQQSIVYPTPLPGINPNSNPPYVALLFSLLTALPYGLSLLTWSALSLLFVWIASAWLYRWLPKRVRGGRLTEGQMSVLVLSFFPFIEGWQVGQNHGLTLLLACGMTMFTLSGRSTLAGLSAGLLLYKPQYVLGFIILWLAWRQWRALAAFGGVALLWGGGYLLLHGLAPYQAYLEVSAELMKLPYNPGFPGYLLVTAYGFFTSFLPQNFQPALQVLTQLLVLGLGAVVAWAAFKTRQASQAERLPAINLALLFPLIAAPYALLHDLLIVVPVFVLWARLTPSKTVLNAAVIVYLAAFFLTLLAYPLDLALLALAPVGLFYFQLKAVRVEVTP